MCALGIGKNTGSMSKGKKSKLPKKKVNSSSTTKNYPKAGSKKG